MRRDEHDFVEVEWLDAVTQNTWQSRKTIATAQKCVSRGWMIRKNRTEVALAATLGLDADDDEINQCCTIPRNMVTKITVIEPKRPLRKKGSSRKRERTQEACSPSDAPPV